MGIPTRHKPTIPDPDEIPLASLQRAGQDPDEIPLTSLQAQSAGDPDEIPLTGVVLPPARPAGLTSPSPIPHNPSVGASQPRPHGPIPTVERPQPEAAGVSSYPQRRASAAPPQPIAKRLAFAPNQQIEILPSAGGISPLPPAPMPAAPIPRITGAAGRRPAWGIPQDR